MGSANATNAALNASKNVEILVALVGRKSKAGGIDALLGADGLGEYLVDFYTSKEEKIDALRQAAEESVERARSRIAEVALSIECSPGAKDGLWALVLTGKIPSLEGIVSASAWPITVNRDFAVNIQDNDAHGGIRLGEFSASSVTGLIAFELKTNHPDVTARFVLNIPVTAARFDCGRVRAEPQGCGNRCHRPLSNPLARQHLAAGRHDGAGLGGCLSVPGLRGVVPRHAPIRYTGFDPHGRPIDREAEGFHARVVQHECDHPIGRLYPTRMTDLTQLGFTSVLFPGMDDNDE